MGIDGASHRLLTLNDVSDSDPAWSPDGSTVAFTSFVDFQGDVRGAADR